MAHRAASTAPANSTSIPSPVVLTYPPAMRGDGGIDDPGTAQNQLDFSKK
jgi:hypothetical protein